MDIEPFVMERWQSTWEHRVEINLSDSGVHPLSVRELFDDATSLDEILSQRLIYTQTNGTPELRSAIAALYPGASPQNIQVVNGGAEANFISIWSLIRPGDEVVMMLPNYMQIAGLVRALGGEVTAWPLRPDHVGGRWVADLDELRGLLSSRTRLIVICNPSNPTGACLDSNVLDDICRAAAPYGSWVLSDEIYQGSELEGDETPTVWGRSERVIVTNSLSKAYGLPGLRLGWIVAPPAQCEIFWSHHDYTTIGPGALSDLIASKVLNPERRRRVLHRARSLLGRNYRLVSEWLQDHTDSLRHIAPRAGAMLMLQYDLPVNSTELATRLRDEKSVLLVPGDHFGMDGWLRIGFGGLTDQVRAGLARLQELLEAER